MDRKVELVGGTTINFIYTLLNTKSFKLDIFQIIFRYNFYLENLDIILMLKLSTGRKFRTDACICNDTP